MDWDAAALIRDVCALGLGEVLNWGVLWLAAIGILLTLAELRLLRRQLRLDALIKITDSNREILALGFAHPELWSSLEVVGGTDERSDPAAPQRYLQLWTNHLYLIWGARRQGMVSDGEWEAYLCDMAGLLRLTPFRKHWLRAARFYPRRFRRTLDELLPMPEEA